MKKDILEFSRRKILVSPSVLASDFSRLGEQIAEVEKAGCDILHLDIMDGHFVPNLTFGPPVVKAIRKCTGLLFDTHFMLTNPKKYVKAFADAGSDLITFHVEADDDPIETIAEIRANGCSAGIVLKPGTPASAVFPYLDKVDLVLVMTVEPGFGGQSFMADQIPKVAELAGEIRSRKLAVHLEVDGGIDAKTAPGIVSAGANVLVAGTAVFRAAEGMGAALEKLHSYAGMLPAE